MGSLFSGSGRCLFSGSFLAPFWVLLAGGPLAAVDFLGTLGASLGGCRESFGDPFGVLWPLFGVPVFWQRPVFLFRGRFRRRGAAGAARRPAPRDRGPAWSRARAIAGPHDHGSRAHAPACCVAGVTSRRVRAPGVRPRARAAWVSRRRACALRRDLSVCPVSRPRGPGVAHRERGRRRVASVEVIVVRHPGRVTDARTRDRVVVHRANGNGRNFRDQSIS